MRDAGLMGDDVEVRKHFIATNAKGLALEFANATLFGLCKPSIQVRVSMFSQHRDECLGQIISEVEITMNCADLCDKLSLLLVQFDRLTHVEKGGLVLGTGGVGCRVWGQHQRVH